MSQRCDELQALLAAEGLEAAASDAAREHLRGCASCRAMLAALRALDGELARLPAADAPDDLVARTLARIAGAAAPVVPAEAPAAALPEEVAAVEVAPRRPAGRLARLRARWRGLPRAFRIPAQLAALLLLSVVGLVGFGNVLGGLQRGPAQGTERLGPEHVRIGSRRTSGESYAIDNGYVAGSPDTNQLAPSATPAPDFRQWAEGDTAGGGGAMSPPELAEALPSGVGIAGPSEQETYRGVEEQLAPKGQDAAGGGFEESEPAEGVEAAGERRNAVGRSFETSSDADADVAVVTANPLIDISASLSAGYGDELEDARPRSESLSAKVVATDKPVGGVLGEDARWNSREPARSELAKDAREAGAEHEKESGNKKLKAPKRADVDGQLSRDKVAMLDADAAEDRKNDASRPEPAKPAPALATPAAITKAEAKLAQEPASGPHGAAMAIARRFLDERERRDGLNFRQPAGYWANSYVPGDPGIRLLADRLRGPRPAALGAAGDVVFDAGSRQYRQPFDQPTDAALAVYLHSDRASLAGPTRLLVQVGIQATERMSGQRPAMNVGVVLDLREPPDTQRAAAFRALLAALEAARRSDDRFSLVVAGTGGGVVIAPGEFRHGPLSVALGRLFGATPGAEAPLESTPPRPEFVDLPQALELARASVAGTDDPNAPLGASVLLLVTASPLGPDLPTLERMAHASAVDGIPLSVVAAGDRVDLDAVDRLALAGQGNRRLLEAPADAARLVDRELHAVSRVVARALRLRIRLARGVELIDVIGSRRLDEASAQRVRDAERSIDQRIARNLGIEADRGEDEEGIQIVIPSFYAGDAHVILLDVVATGGAGSVADVTARYKDLVSLRNGVARSNLSIGAAQREPGRLERNVLKNLVATQVAAGVRQAGQLLAAERPGQAQAALFELKALVEGLPLLVPGWAGDAELTADARMLSAYHGAIAAGAHQHDDARLYLADSLRYAAFLKVVPPLARPGGADAP